VTLAPGSSLGPYTITGPLGKGGMGEVWRARDSRLGRDVAIKALPTEFAGDPDRLARFEREAKVLASLNHSNIASIYGLEQGNGQRFLVLELVEGETLAERIARGAIGTEEALRLAVQIAEGIEAAHEKDIIHRDLKPANIKLTPDGKVKILDFGLAKAFEGSGSADNVFNSPTLSLAATAQGVILGTAAYMSPEQARGQAVDRRTDIWAFGCILYEMLTGRHAFRGEHVSDILASVLAREPEFADLPPGMPPRLKEALRRCFEKNPKRRWQAIGDLRVELEQILADPTAGIVAPPAARTNYLATLLAVAATAAIAVAATWFLKPSPPPEPRPISRFDIDVPSNVTLRNPGRPMLALSPDGRYVAYNTLTGITLRSMDAVTARLVPSTEQPLASPFFSPNGEWLAYFTPGASMLMKVPISGGTAVPITQATGLFGASWGRDNNIVFGQDNSIRRVSADGGTSIELIKMKPGDTPYGPSLLPDGKTILYSVAHAITTTRWDEAEIVAQQPGGTPKVIVRGGSDPVYVPTGHLLYVVGNTLNAIAFDPTTLEKSGGPVALVSGLQRATGPQVNTGSANYGVSEHGTLTYLGEFATQTSESILAIVDRTGAAKPLNLATGTYRSPRVSPDGRRLAVETVTNTNQNVIWVWDFSGTTALRRLTQEGDNSRPVWSSDSKRIAYGRIADEDAGIFWQPADGSGLPERLTTPPKGFYDFPESFSSDGKVMSFVRAKAPLVGNSWGIWTMRLDTTERKPEVFFDLPDSNEFGSSFSPDGKWIAYASNADPNPKNPATRFAIYVQPYPPTGVKYEITQTGGAWPIWGAGGHELIYRLAGANGLSPRLNVVTITTNPVPMNSSEKILPVSNVQPLINYREYDAIPRTDRLLIVLPPAAPTGNPQRQIHVVLNWTEELKARVPTKVR
jgi:serine/threonine-protein kinase